MVSSEAAMIADKQGAPVLCRRTCWCGQRRSDANANAVAPNVDAGVGTSVHWWPRVHSERCRRTLRTSLEMAATSAGSSMFTRCSMYR